VNIETVRYYQRRGLVGLPPKRARGFRHDSRGLARELDRDVKRVHEDVSTLIKHGLIVRTADRKICVPYDVIHADFDLWAVA
jgi:hypothetical protein